MSDFKPPEKYSTYPEYVRNWQRAMKQAYNLASAQAKKSADRNWSANIETMS